MSKNSLRILVAGVVLMTVAAIGSYLSVRARREEDRVAAEVDAQVARTFLAAYFNAAHESSLTPGGYAIAAGDDCGVLMIRLADRQTGDTDEIRRTWNGTARKYALEHTFRGVLYVDEHQNVWAWGDPRWRTDGSAGTPRVWSSDALRRLDEHRGYLLIDRLELCKPSNTLTSSRTPTHAAGTSPRWPRSRRSAAVRSACSSRHRGMYYDSPRFVWTGDAEWTEEAAAMVRPQAALSLPHFGGKVRV